MNEATNVKDSKIAKFKDSVQEIFTKYHLEEKLNVVRQILFYVGFTGVLVYLSTYYSSLLVLSLKTKTMIANVSLILLFTKILLTKEKIWKYFLFGFLIIMAYACETNIGIPYHMTFIIVPMIACRGLDIKKVIRYVFIFNCVLLSYQVFCYVMNQIGFMDYFPLEEERILYRNGHIRHTFFFFHPNTFSNYLFWTYMMFVYLHFDNKKMHKVIVILAIILATFVYLFPASRNACSFFILSIPLLFLYQNKRIQKCNTFRYFNILIFTLCFVVSFILAVLYGTNGILGTIIKPINRFLSGRISLGYNYLVEYGTSLLGILMSSVRNLKAVGVERVVIDNWYYYMYIRIGLFFTIFYFVTFFRGLCHFTKQKNFAIMYTMVIFLLYNCIEAVGVNPQLAFPFFFLGMLL